MQRTRWIYAFALVVLLALLAGPLQRSNFGASSALAALSEPNFNDTQVTTASSPTALAFTPDGRMLIAQRAGTLVVLKAGVKTTALSITSKVCSNFERGLLGVAVDPAFATNKHIYIFYSFDKFNDDCAAAISGTSRMAVNRISRLTLSDANVASGETVIVDNIPSYYGWHNGGDINFGKDGMLYISTGDSGALLGDPTKRSYSNSNSRRRDILSGKILRVTKDGLPPSDNPWFGQTGSRRCGNPAGVPSGTGPCQETWVWGLRQPFRFAMDPNASGTAFYINDVGQDNYDEIDIAAKGADYGWNNRESFCVASNTITGCRSTPNATVNGQVDPIYTHPHPSGGTCSSITGGAFVPNGVWPSQYNGRYIFADYACGTIWFLQRNADGSYGRANFVTSLGTSSVTHLEFGTYNGKTGLYYASFGGGGQVRLVAYTGTTNRPPVAVASGSPTSGAAPLTVAFSSSGSSDPDGDAITYEWNFGDGTTSTSANPSHTYSSSGTFNATLRVKDSKGAFSDTATVQIQSGNSAPQPSISSPTSSYLFRVGETITLSGSASDAQDGTLPASSLSWEVLLHHDAHTHPFLAPTSGNNLTITAPPPEDFAAATNSYLEIKLTATDSQGLKKTIVQNLNPKKVSVTFQTSPAGLQVAANSESFTGPTTVTAWEALKINLSAPNQGSWVFSSWSDGGAQSHLVTVPAGGATYSATFTESQTPGLTLSNLNARDTANPEWSLQTNIQAGNTAYGDRTYTIETLPATLAGQPWVRPAADSKSYAGNPLVSFSISAQADIYISLDDRLVRPSWVDGTWVDTGTDLSIRESSTTVRPHSLYRKTFAAGTVSLGPLGSTTAPTYLVIAKPSGGTIPPTATRTSTRTNTPTGPTATRTNTPTGPTATRTRTRTATTSSGYPAWAPNTAYSIGSRVSYNGVNYECIQAHTSQAGWEPPNVASLWRQI